MVREVVLTFSRYLAKQMLASQTARRWNGGQNVHGSTRVIQT